MRRKETFIVKVDADSSGTWRGKVVWADENRTENFRSSLELIELMDGALKRDRNIQSNDVAQ